MLNDLHVPVPPAIVLRIARMAAFATRTLLGALLIAMMLLNVANAVCRYLFSVVLIGADELLVFAMIWMVMIGMILVTINRQHIALDFLANRLAQHARALRSQCFTTSLSRSAQHMRPFSPWSSRGV